MEESCRCWTCWELRTTEPIIVDAAVGRKGESNPAEMAATAEYMRRMDATDARIACIEARLTQLNSRCRTPTLGSQSASISEPKEDISSGRASTAASGEKINADLGTGNGHARECESGSSPVQERLTNLLVGNKCDDFKFCRVPSDYYDLTYEQRQVLLGAASVDHLCKSIVMVNTQAAADVVDCTDKNNSKYYLIVVQYAAKLNTEKVRSFVHSLNMGTIPKKRFNMRLAPETTSDELTGFQHNAVTPIGMKTAIPIILSQAIVDLRPDFFWLGGGEVDLKLGIRTSQFIDLLHPFIVDIS